MRVPNRNQVGAAVLIVGGFVFALTFIPMALELLRDGVFNYAPAGQPARLVTPTSAPFLFYSETIFLFSIGSAPLFFSIAGILTAIVFSFNSNGVERSTICYGLLLRSTKFFWYFGVAFGVAFIVCAILIAFKP